MKVKSNKYTAVVLQCYCCLLQALELPQWQRVKMLAEGPSEERKFCHLTSVHSRTARVQELSETLTACEDGFPGGESGC